MTRNIVVFSLMLLPLLVMLTHATAIPARTITAETQTPMKKTSALLTKRKFRDSDVTNIIPAVHSENLISRNNNNNVESLVTRDKIGKKRELTNHEILNKLGLTKLKMTPNHHRKRLAVESRHHTRPDDSHMFVIKLPPNQSYYTFTKPIGSKNDLIEQSQKVGFKSNGKPGKIYHWNLPVLKRMIGTHGRNQLSRHADNEADLIDIKNIPTWSKTFNDENNNETADKHYSSDNKTVEKNLKKKYPTYYAPAKPKTIKNNSNTQKYFPGNGKPQSFYVIEKSHKPAYYQKLIP